MFRQQLPILEFIGNFLFNFSKLSILTLLQKTDNNLLTLLKDQDHGFNTLNKNKTSNQNIKMLPQVLNNWETKQNKSVITLRRQWANQYLNQHNLRKINQNHKRWTYKERAQIQQTQPQMNKNHKKCKLNDWNEEIKIN